MSGAESLSGEWFEKAEEDALSLRAVLKEGAPITACFLAQQMAEKYLKGLLAAHHVEFPKVHNLVAHAPFASDGRKDWARTLEVLLGGVSS